MEIEGRERRKISKEESKAAKGTARSKGKGRRNEVEEGGGGGVVAGWVVL